MNFVKFEPFMKINTSKLACMHDYGIRPTYIIREIREILAVANSLNKEPPQNPAKLKMTTLYPTLYFIFREVMNPVTNNSAQYIVL